MDCYPGEFNGNRRDLIERMDVGGVDNVMYGDQQSKVYNMGATSSFYRESRRPYNLSTRYARESECALENPFAYKFLKVQSNISLQ